MLKEKIKARKLGNVYRWSEEEYNWGGGKKAPTGELELFKKIALERSYDDDMFGIKVVSIPHIDKEGRLTRKIVNIENLTPTNFSHILPKSTHPELRLEPENIQIVSMAYHHYEHTKQILKVDYPN